MRRASTTIVAQRAGVSQATVSYVLNGKFQDRISDETRRRVMDAAKDLGYKPNNLARSLLSGKSKTVGFLLPSFEGMFYASILRGADKAFDALGYNLLCCCAGTSRERETNLIEFFVGHRVDGMLCIANTYSVVRMREWIAAVDTASCPLVIIDDSSVSDQVDCVVSDDVAGMGMAVDHLVGLGHRRIAHLCGTWVNSATQDRSIGYRLGLERNGIAYDESLDVHVTEGGTRGAYFEAIKSLLTMPNRPTAIVPDADGMFEKYYTECLWNRELDPGAFSVVGYSNQDTSRVFDMTSISQNPEQMGARAAELLLERMETPTLPPRLIRIEPSLVVRSSCRHNPVTK